MGKMWLLQKQAENGYVFVAFGSVDHIVGERRCQYLKHAFLTMSMRRPDRGPDRGKMPIAVPRNEVFSQDLDSG